jgi:hypothetical protein
MVDFRADFKLLEVEKRSLFYLDKETKFSSILEVNNSYVGWQSLKEQSLIKSLLLKQQKCVLVPRKKIGDFFLNYRKNLSLRHYRIFSRHTV